mmetsp:Transcript_80871/g.196177  ORF Transcript_80871/g.196177 Transcript_80871/m.196177 type:complete len:603 (+) Transcript_80871:661-2469(+)
MHAVVSGRGGEHDGRVLGGAAQPVVRRVALEEGPVLGHLRVAELAHPRGSGEQLAVPVHVEQRHLADDGAEELGRADQHVTGEQPAVGAALDGELLRAGDPPPHEVRRHRLEVLVRLVPLLLERGLVPARAELAAAADVGLGVDAALLEPADADGGGVARCEADLKAAVAVEQRRRRAVEAERLGADEEVGHLGAVGRRGLELLRLQAVRVVHVGEGLELLLRRAERLVRPRERVGRRLGVAAAREPHVVRLGGAYARGGDGREAIALAAGVRLLEHPLLLAVAPQPDLGAHVVEHVEDEVVERLPLAVERERGRGREERDHLDGLAPHEGQQRHGEERACRVRRASEGPLGAQRDEELVGEGARLRVVLHGHLDKGAVGHANLVLGGPEGHGALPPLVRLAAVVVEVPRGGHVGLLALIHERCVGERRAALPLAHGARVARVSHAALAHVGAHQQHVAAAVAEVTLRLGQPEAALALTDEALLVHVEFAYHGRVGTSARQLEHHTIGAHLGALVQHHRALPHPRLALLLAEGVEVEHRLPRRRGLAVLGQSGAAPDTTNVVLVLPKVVVEAVEHAADVGNLLLAVEDRQDPRVVLGRLGVA